MSINDQFDRLDKLILDRCTDISTMRGILHSIREQVEAYQQDGVEHTKLKQAYAALDAEHIKLKGEHLKHTSRSFSMIPPHIPSDGVLPSESCL